ncbi:MAG: phytanoyl-CoA dioxygenase family protein [Planctomycetota bacterium]|nr:phytanoyl-CoA dioxygenase family protein [Planctomycetota bacterium]MDA1139391.1 phytanoyl-CoA dioxygenase family protein [Planctomycetota bacterium]
MDKKYLLTTGQMAQFVADGFLCFDEFIPAELNKAAHDVFESKNFGRFKQGKPLFEAMPEDHPVGRIFRLPEVQGITHSLVGPDPLYDHHAVHTVPAGQKHGQHWHGDAIIDTRTHFDIQYFYFCHDTPLEMGGTMILPGSHFRQINTVDIGRYQNFMGQHKFVCKAGTLAVVHHGMWHCAQPNRTADTRYMFKLRLNPMVRQLRLWNTDDYESGDWRGALGKTYRWMGNEDRLEVVNHIKLWRFLSGDKKFDLGYWLSRLENMPENLLEAS